MQRVVAPPSSLCRSGLAVADITPPVGIYHRMWGAATHDRSTGVHRPLRATALALSPLGGEAGFVLVALDHCLLWEAEMTALRDAVLSATELSPERLMVTFSHTHAAGLMDPGRQDQPGGDLIAPYLHELTRQVVAIVQEARQAMTPCAITYGTGHCALAAHRDAYDEQSQQWVCGYHPDGPADDTLLVARVTDPAGGTVATIVNYGCHPTTLAWENTLISPDYPGAMRATIEEETGAPCLFLLGACGDLGPREGYVGDVAVADRNGRQLAYAAMSTLTALPPPETEFAYRGPVVSGATLGDWRHRPLSEERRSAARDFQLKRWQVGLPYRADRPQVADMLADRERWSATEQTAHSQGNTVTARDARAMVERLTRALTRWQSCPPGDEYPYEITLLKLGDVVWVMVGGEPYQQLQTELRRRFPDLTLIVIVLADSWKCSYLPPREIYGLGIYQEQIAMLAPGCLERVIDAISENLALSQREAQG